MAKRLKDFIKSVAIYLRKSRDLGDGEDALIKHRKEFIDYAESKGWDYEIFEEGIMSGEELDNRPAMQRLLKLVKRGAFDAVLVVEIPRLSRGSQKDFGTIIEAFQFSNTYIALPDNRIFDTNDDTDITMLGITGVFSNTELRYIKRRFQDGKKRGAKLGKWTNGKPPYPYYYDKHIEYDMEKKRDRIVGQIAIDPAHEKVYRRIIDMYLTGQHGTLAIAEALNRDNIPGIKGQYWTATAVQRLLLHEFHMGKIVYGKNIWKYDKEEEKNVVIPRDEAEVSVGYGDHPKLKTQEEHEKILAIMGQNTKLPRRSRQGVFATAGILHCKKCGKMMNYSVGKVEKKTGECWDYTKCSYKSPMGEKCPQKSLKMTTEFFDAVYNAVINSYLSSEKMRQAQEYAEKVSNELALIKLKKNEITEAQKNLIKFEKVYLKDGYTPEQYIAKKKEQEKIIEDREKEIRRLEKLSVKEHLTPSEIEQHVQNFKENWDRLDNTGKNKLLKTFIDKIFYDRDGDTVTLEVVYL